MPKAEARRYRLFSWEHSYFSGKVRAFLRYKSVAGTLAFEDVLATPELIQGLLIPATGTNVVPQPPTGASCRIRARSSTPASASIPRRA
jgi:hypothetical protein